MLWTLFILAVHILSGALVLGGIYFMALVCLELRNKHRDTQTTNDVFVIGLLSVVVGTILLLLSIGGQQ